MAITDIIVLVIIALGMTVGYFKGFFKGLASLLGTLVSLVLAFVLTTFTVDAITGIGGLHNVLYGETGSLAGSISNALPDAMKDMTVIEASTEAGKEAITAALGGGLMGLLTPLILSLVGKFATAELQTVPMADCIGVIAARSIAWVILFILYFIILKLLSRFLRKIGDMMAQRHVSRTVDRVCGMVVGGAKGVLWTAVLLFVLALMSGLGFMGFYRTDMEKSVIAKPISDFTVRIIGGYINLDKITGGLIPSADKPEEGGKEEPGEEQAPEKAQKLFAALPEAGAGYVWAL